MDQIIVTVTRYHEMFASMLEGYHTGRTHNTFALAVKDATGSRDVEALLSWVYINGEKYVPINMNDDDILTNLKDITDPIEITLQHEPQEPLPTHAKVQIAYIGAQLVDIEMARHPTDGLRRVKILKYLGKDAHPAERYLAIFYHDCLITKVQGWEEHAVFSHNVREIDRNGGIHP